MPRLSVTRIWQGVPGDGPQVVDDDRALGKINDAGDATHRVIPVAAVEDDGFLPRDDGDGFDRGFARVAS
jgi:hypothetical protein